LGLLFTACLAACGGGGDSGSAPLEDTSQVNPSANGLTVVAASPNATKLVATTLVAQAPDNDGTVAYTASIAGTTYNFSIDTNERVTSLPTGYTASNWGFIILCKDGAAKTVFS